MTDTDATTNAASYWRQASLTAEIAKPIGKSMLTFFVAPEIVKAIGKLLGNPAKPEMTLDGKRYWYFTRDINDSHVTIQSLAEFAPAEERVSFAGEEMMRAELPENEDKSATRRGGK